ncbi:protein of unknown function [Pararobbsia alpina]
MSALTDTRVSIFQISLTLFQTTLRRGCPIVLSSPAALALQPSTTLPERLLAFFDQPLLLTFDVNNDER